jgi:FtsH-binding integral membrane protein
MIMRFTSLIVPPQGASALLRVRGILLLIGIVILLLAVGAGLVQLAGLAFGGVSLLTSIWAGILLVAVALGVLIWLGRRRQRRAVAARAQAGG